ARSGLRRARRRYGPEARSRAVEGRTRRKDRGIRDLGTLAVQGPRRRLDADAAHHRLRQRKRAASRVWRRIGRKHGHAANVRRTRFPRRGHGLGHQARRARSARYRQLLSGAPGDAADRRAGRRMACDASRKKTPRRSGAKSVEMGESPDQVNPSRGFIGQRPLALGHDGLRVFADRELADRSFADWSLADRRRRRRRLLARQIGGGAALSMAKDATVAVRIFIIIIIPLCLNRISPAEPVRCPLMCPARCPPLRFYQCPSGNDRTTRKLPRAALCPALWRKVPEKTDGAG